MQNPLALIYMLELEKARNEKELQFNVESKKKRKKKKTFREKLQLVKPSTICSD